MIEAKLTQMSLVKMTPEQLAHLRSQLSGLVREYIELEDEKKAANEDFNERMADIWEEIRGLRLRITEAEEASEETNE